MHLHVAARVLKQHNLAARGWRMITSAANNAHNAVVVHKLLYIHYATSLRNTWQLLKQGQHCHPVLTSCNTDRGPAASWPVTLLAPGGPAGDCY